MKNERPMKQTASSKDLLSFLWSFLKETPFTVFLLLIVSFTWSFDSTLWPYTLRVIIDTLSSYEQDRSHVFEALKFPLIGGLSLWLLIEFGFRMQGFLLSRFTPDLESKIRMRLFDHIQRHSPKYFNKHLAGSLTNKITDMTTHITQAIWQFLYSLIPAFGAFLVSLYFYSQINLFFTFALCTLIAIYTVICLAFSKKCTEKEQQHAESRSTLLGKILDSFTNNFTVNLLYRFADEKRYIQHIQNEERLKHFHAKRSVELMRMSLSLAFLTGGMIINGYMLILWRRGQLSTGEIVQIFNMTWNIILILWYAGVEIPSLFQSIGILKQALSIFHEKEEILDEPHLPDLQVQGGEIVFENVSFDYEEKKLFHNKSLKIKAGEKIGLVGQSGAGKSTLVNLILRLYPLKEGGIYIDNQNISSVSLESLRKQIAFIPQDPLLFHRSISENISYGRPSALLEDIIETAKLAACDPFIVKCSEGYTTVVGERGSKLSGGERQRIAIARAMISKAPIVILDEATSALDSLTEHHIQQSLEKLMNGKTTIVIAHRLSTLAKMDRILVLHEGKIVEEGTHEELLSKKGYYVKMWEMQTGALAQEALYCASVLP